MVRPILCCVHAPIRAPDHFGIYFSVTMKRFRKASISIFHLFMCDFAGLPLVLQTLILQYVDHTTCRALVNLSQSDPSQFGWLHMACSDMALRQRQLQALPKDYIDGMLDAMDLAREVVYELPGYKIDLMFVLDRFMHSWNLHFVADFNQTKYISQYQQYQKRLGIKATIALGVRTCVSPLIHLDSNGLGWLSDQSADMLARLRLAANLPHDFQFQELGRYDVSHRFPGRKRIIAVIAPVLHEYIWSREDLYHHSYLIGDQFDELGQRLDQYLIEELNRRPPQKHIKRRIKKRPLDVSEEIDKRAKSSGIETTSVL